MPRPVGGDECSEFKNPIGRTFLSGNPHFRRDWKVSAIREAPPCGRGASLFLHEAPSPSPLPVGERNGVRGDFAKGHEFNVTLNGEAKAFPAHKYC